MKKFIIISLLAAVVLPAKPCLWFDTYNSYLFSPYDPHEFRDRVEGITNDNWKVYLNTDEEYFWFNAEDAIKAAQKKNDQLMVSYIQNLQKYLKCSDEKQMEQWNYPTKQQLTERRQTLLSVRTYAQGKLKTRLRSQHALLVMRCNMLLGRHADNVTFWNTTGSNMIESVYRDMMRNIYAGALYHTGSEDAATQIFAEQGDWKSLMTIYYKRRSYTAIRQEYLHRPDSPVLPFLLKDFVNNAQEAIDAQGNEGEFGGKLFIRNISKAEANQMIALAAQVVKEGKTPVPMLWQSAKAWLEFMYGQQRQAATDILAATKMEGTERMKDNARVLLLYITSAQAPDSQDFDNYLADELTWLDTKITNDHFFLAARNRLTHQVLNKKYANRPTINAALLRTLADGDWMCYVDTTRIENLKAYINYASGSGKTALDRYLISRLQLDRNAMNDLVGTKYMRLCQWQQAIEWLSKVPATYYSTMGYAVYAAKRRWTVEPWLKRQWLKEGEEWSEQKPSLSANPKLEFAREMQKLEAEKNMLTGLAQQQRCYDLAVRYSQAHYTGDCWFLMRDSKSISDTVRVNESDLGKKVLQLLRQASQATDFKLKEKALFAMTYGYLYAEEDAWCYSEWDSSAADFVVKERRQSPQYKALTALAALEKQNATRTSQYVSRCDEYIQFRKQFN